MSILIVIIQFVFIDDFILNQEQTVRRFLSLNVLKICWFLLSIKNQFYFWRLVYRISLEFNVHAHTHSRP